MVAVASICHRDLGSRCGAGRARPAGHPAPARGRGGRRARGVVHRSPGGEVRAAGDRMARQAGVPGARAAGSGRRAGARRHRVERRRQRPMLEEVRITGLGVIDDAVLEPSPGLTVVTGETGAGQDDGGDRARPAVRRARRPGAGAAGRGPRHRRGAAAHRPGRPRRAAGGRGGRRARRRRPVPGRQPFGVCRGAIARACRRPLGARVAAHLSRRRARRGARPGRPAAAAAARPGSGPRWTSTPATSWPPCCPITSAPTTGTGRSAGS